MPPSSHEIHGLGPSMGGGGWGLRRRRHDHRRPAGALATCSHPLHEICGLGPSIWGGGWGLLRGVTTAAGQEYRRCAPTRCRIDFDTTMSGEHLPRHQNNKSKISALLI
uniref:Uncharacterized protein n=1 Tax=Leersia perrieri TaxID=77586 RepID=A0A0D9X6Q1_9ORYZ